MGKPNKPTKPTDKKPKARRDWRTPFLKALATNGVVVDACRKAKVDKSTVYDARRDEAFAKAWDEAIESSVQAMESELYRRAVKGTRKPVYQGGVLVGHVQEYSDTLLIFALKSNKPEKYREPKGDINVTVAPPTVPDHVARAALEAAQLAADGGKDLGPAE